MSLPVFTYIARKHRGYLQHDEVLCPQCLEDLPLAARTPEPMDRHGHEQIVKPWTGAVRECCECGKTPEQCEAAQVAQAERAAEADFEAYHGGATPQTAGERMAAGYDAMNARRR